MIELRDVTKSYGGKEVLHGIDLTIADGEVFGVIGASGAGKSTLVRCINLLERPTSGSIVIDGKDVTNYQGKALHDLRESIGMIFQHFSLFQQRSVLENVCFPMELNHRDKAEREERARHLLAMVELDGFENAYPSQLSGGQQQRVAIARALANEPKVMLCDEATSALDTKTTMSVLDLLGRVNKELGVTMVMITHSLQVARHGCDHIAVIDSGRIVEEGKTMEVFSNPQSTITKDLLAFDNIVASMPAGESGKAVL